MKHWITHIDQTTDSFVNLFGSLTREDLNWKPNPETWSIAQNIDHLIVINQSYFPILADMRAGRFKPPFPARFGFVVSFLGKTILNAVEPTRTKKTKTFAIWEPSTSQIPGDIVQRFAKHQAQLKREIEASKTLLDAEAVICSPANKNIVYPLETAFDVIVTHEQRHLNQAKAVYTLLQKRQPSLAHA